MGFTYMLKQELSAHTKLIFHSGR